MKNWGLVSNIVGCLLEERRPFFCRITAWLFLIYNVLLSYHHPQLHVAVSNLVNQLLGS
uniref:Uncharacterized protein n=1 Tax=Arundo donax TaxID=35708 RepID=A0A0A9G218_ARUDO